jgi:hypothetical protein
MSLLPPEKWRFCKLSPMSTSPASDSSASSTLTESPQSSPQPSPSTTPVPRLNKKHGFLQHIIQNQIERDEYEKAIAQTRANRDQQYQRNRVDEKVSQNRYIPPHLRRFVNPSSPQISFIDDSQQDPHHEMRTRARRSLQKEMGIVLNVQ